MSVQKMISNFQIDESGGKKPPLVKTKSMVEEMRQIYGHVEKKTAKQEKKDEPSVVKDMSSVFEPNPTPKKGINRAPSLNISVSSYADRKTSFEKTYNISDARNVFEDKKDTDNAKMSNVKVEPFKAKNITIESKKSEIMENSSEVSVDSSTKEIKNMFERKISVSKHIFVPNGRQIIIEEKEEVVKDLPAEKLQPEKDEQEEPHNEETDKADVGDIREKLSNILEQKANALQTCQIDYTHIQPSDEVETEEPPVTYSKEDIDESAISTDKAKELLSAFIETRTKKQPEPDQDEGFSDTSRISGDLQVQEDLTSDDEDKVDSNPATIDDTFKNDLSRTLLQRQSLRD